MITTTAIGYRLGLLAAVLASAVGAWLAVRHGVDVHLLSEAAGIDQEDQEGVSGLVRVAEALQAPALVAAGALIPLVLIGGAVMIMIGNRRGMSYIAATAGAMMILASIGGLSA
jgi:hypothetical protein